MKELYFVAQDGNKKFKYLITQKGSDFILSILIFSKSVIEGIPIYDVGLVSPIEDTSEYLVIQKADNLMHAILKDVSYAKTDKFGEIEDLISRISGK